jgi:hypothetical protein
MTRAQRKVLEMLERGWGTVWLSPWLEPGVDHPDFVGPPCANRVHLTTRKIMDSLAVGGFIERDEDDYVRLTDKGREVLTS